MDTIAQLDRDWLLWFNGFHASWLDPVMLLLTKTWAWLPLFILITFLIYKKFKINTGFILIGIAIGVSLSDRITSGLMKPYFLRPRPTHEPALQGLIHTVGGYYGGQYGFASSHAANVFAAAVIIWWFLRDQYKYAWTIFIWSVFVSYTRIYLGVHYPGDVIAGGITGVLCGVAGCWVAQLLIKKWGSPAIAN